jgi:hypothetical protein
LSVYFQFNHFLTKNQGLYLISKIFRAAARAGREFIFPTPLFLPAPPEQISVLFLPAAKGGGQLKFKVRIFLEKSSDFD